MATNYTPVTDDLLDYLNKGETPRTRARARRAAEIREATEGRCPLTRTTYDELIDAGTHKAATDYTCACWDAAEDMGFETPY